MAMLWNCNTTAMRNREREKFQVNNMPKIRKRRREK